jgi:hypothetical protein
LTNSCLSVSLSKMIPWDTITNEREIKRGTIRRDA